MTTARGGAPRGNQNARKHGYYSRQKPPPPSSADVELARLRRRFADIMAYAGTVSDPLRLGTAVTTLTRAALDLARFAEAQAGYPPDLINLLDQEFLLELLLNDDLAHWSHSS